MHSYVHCSIIHNSQDTGKNEMSFSIWTYKDNLVHGCDGILLSCQTDEMLPSATTQTDFENIVLSEISQTEKGKNHTFHLYVGYKTESDKWTNQKNKWTETHGNRHQYGGCQKERGIVVKGKVDQNMTTEKDLISCGRHTMQYPDEVSQNRTLEACIIFLINVTSINLI